MQRTNASSAKSSHIEKVITREASLEAINFNIQEHQAPFFRIVGRLSSDWDIRYKPNWTIVPDKMPPSSAGDTEWPIEHKGAVA